MTPHLPQPERLESPSFVALPAIHADFGGRETRAALAQAELNHG